MNPIIQYFQTQVDKPDAQSPSAVGRWLKGILKEVKPGYISMEYVVRKDMLNPAGTLHGGMMSLMMDEIIGMATFSLYTPYMYTSVNLSVDFLRPAKAGETLTVVANTVRQGQQIINMEASITNEAGDLIATSSSNMGITRNKNAFFQEKA